MGKKSAVKEQLPEGSPGFVVKQERVAVQITPPNIGVTEFLIEGTTPFVQHKMSEKVRRQIRDTQERGSQAKKNIKREPRDFKADYKGALYVAEQGWHGIPAAAFRNAMISACRLVGFKMTIAKMTVFVEGDGYDGPTALVRFLEGEPAPTEPLPVRNDDGSLDLRVRPMWQPGWRMKLRVRYDRDQFSTADVANLLARAGQQVGVGEGRPDSKNSPGQGWGLFRIAGQ